MKYSTIILFCILFCESDGFVRHQLASYGTPSIASVRLFQNSRNSGNLDFVANDKINVKSQKVSSFALFRRRLNTIEAAGLDCVHTAGVIGSVSNLVQKIKNLPQDIQNLTWKDVKPIQRIKGLHGPITYMILAVLFAQKYKWAWRNPAWWFGIAFCIKWCRARYLFKIPVWDRQPNWNNVITSKEQEKDLKAYTCKTCGSTIFIAKTREFFFEGRTGIGGLGCFSCGAKGADNFVMDRDRIVEDVADVDDYFEYERPLDFISRAERRALMKEAGGDEEKANQILVERSNSQASEQSRAQAEAIVNGVKKESTISEAERVVEETDEAMEVEDAMISEENVDDSAKESLVAESKGEELSQVDVELSAKSSSAESKPSSRQKEPANPNSDRASPPSGDDDLDLLGMDDF